MAQTDDNIVAFFSAQWDGVCSIFIFLTAPCGTDCLAPPVPNRVGHGMVHGFHPSVPVVSVHPVKAVGGWDVCRCDGFSACVQAPRGGELTGAPEEGSNARSHQRFFCLSTSCCGNVGAQRNVLPVSISFRMSELRVFACECSSVFVEGLRFKSFPGFRFHVFGSAFVPAIPMESPLVAKHDEESASKRPWAPKGREAPTLMDGF